MYVQLHTHTHTTERHTAANFEFVSNTKRGNRRENETRKNRSDRMKINRFRMHFCVLRKRFGIAVYCKTSSIYVWWTADSRYRLIFMYVSPWIWSDYPTKYFTQYFFIQHTHSHTHTNTDTHTHTHTHTFKVFVILSICVIGILSKLT